MNTFELLARVLAERTEQVRVFFRDDDAGWADQRLKALCECFVQQEIPLDIAAIPAAMDEESVSQMRDLLSGGAAWLHVHQHGFRHVNHQQEGRSCEFGTHRDRSAQLADIEQGQQILANAFDGQAEPLFTPPWNRCTPDTTIALQSLGFTAYSRIAGSEAIDTELPSLDVSIDWLKKRKGVRLGASDICRLACEAFRTGDKPVGVMLHHEHMDEANRALLIEFIDVLKSASTVRFCAMSELIYA